LSVSSPSDLELATPELCGVVRPAMTAAQSHLLPGCGQAIESAMLN